MLPGPIGPQLSWTAVHGFTGYLERGTTSLGLLIDLELYDSFTAVITVFTAGF